MKHDKKELILDLIEVRAYRDLQNMPFDFGNGVIIPDSKTSEDAHFKMREQDILDNLEDLSYVDAEKEKDTTPTTRNRYMRKFIGRKKLKKLYDKGVYNVWEKDGENGTFLTQFYLSGSKKVAKKCSNKTIRQSRNNFPLNGSGYRKKYDYWWLVY